QMLKNFRLASIIANQLAPDRTNSTRLHAIDPAFRNHTNWYPTNRTQKNQSTSNASPCSSTRTKTRSWKPLKSARSTALRDCPHDTLASLHSFQAIPCTPRHYHVRLPSSSTKT